MDTHLTEIKNAHLFMEYLMSIGAKSPRSRRDNWELVVDILLAVNDEDSYCD